MVKTLLRYLGCLLLVAWALLSGESALSDPIDNLKALQASKGLAIDAAYVFDIERNLDPGIISQQRKTAYLGVITLGVSIDTGEAGWWGHGKFHVSGIHTHGRQPSANVIGDLQVASNIEAQPETILYEAWYEHRFADDRIYLLAGLHDLDAEFAISSYALLFLNSSFGIGADISANVPTSIFPRAGLGVRLKYEPTPSVTFATAVYDGNPASRKLSKSEGQMVIAEFAYRYQISSGLDGDVKSGLWQHTASMTAPSGQVFPHDYGAYLLIDQQLFRWNDGSLGVFGRYGAVPQDRNAVTSNFATGLNVAGLWPGRSDDVAGLGMTRVVSQYAPGKRGAETTWEMTYQASFGDHIRLQPSFQWIQHPQGNPANPNVRVLIGRLMIDL